MVETAPSSTPDKRPTLQMVADAAGVSVATVSYVLSGRVGRTDGVRAETRERVRVAAEELGYRRRRSATRPRTHTVLVVMPESADLWTQTLVDTVTRTLAPHEATVLLQFGGDWHRVLAQRSVDLVVVGQPDETRPARTAIGRLVARGDRLILWSRTLPPRGYDVIRPNDREAIRVGLGYLARRYGRVVYLDSGRHHLRPRTRLDAARRALRADADANGDANGDVHGDDAGTGLVDVVSLAPGDSTRDVLASMLTRRPRPAAVLTCSDAQAHRVREAAQEMGLRVPDDLAVLGLGDTEFGRTDGSTRLSSLGETRGFDIVAELIARRLRPGPYEPAVHEVQWSVQRPGLSA